MKRGVTAIVSVGLLNACVVGAETPPNAVQLAHGPPPARSERTAGTVIAEAVTATRSARPRQPEGDRAGVVWVRGYYHFDGVRFVYVPGHWEPRATRFEWQRSGRARPDRLRP